MTIKLTVYVSQLVLLLVVLGCSRKQDTSAMPPPSTAAATNLSPEAAAVSVTTSKALADSDAALKARQYDQAVANLLLLQQQRGLNEQQAQAVKDQQVKIQRSLASAVASGDPKAKAAADMLRASSAHR
jgi:hypothetical protein